MPRAQRPSKREHTERLARAAEAVLRMKTSPAGSVRADRPEFAELAAALSEWELNVPLSPAK